MMLKGRFHPPQQARSLGFTLIELLVVVALLAILVALAAPGFKRFIDTQRLRSVNAALITDLQFARSEAASRNEYVVVKFDHTGGSLTCYAILTGDQEYCDCKIIPSPTMPVCGGTAQKEIRTTRVDRSLSLTVAVPDAVGSSAIRFDPATGRLEVFALDVFSPPASPFLVDVSNPEIGTFRNAIEATGRPTSCSPGGLISGVAAC